MGRVTAELAARTSPIARRATSQKSSPQDVSAQLS
jgi:hypothetical protein